jgi:hypothetical protein
VWRGTSTIKCASFVPTTYCIQGFDGVEISLQNFLGTDYYYPASPTQPQSSVGPTGAGFGSTDFAFLVTAGAFC